VFGCLVLSELRETACKQQTTTGAVGQQQPLWIHATWQLTGESCDYHAWEPTCTKIKYFGQQQQRQAATAAAAAAEATTGDCNIEFILFTRS